MAGPIYLQLLTDFFNKIDLPDMAANLLSTSTIS